MVKKNFFKVAIIAGMLSVGIQNVGMIHAAAPNEAKQYYEKNCSEDHKIVKKSMLAKANNTSIKGVELKSIKCKPNGKVTFVWSKNKKAPCFNISFSRNSKFKGNYTGVLMIKNNKKGTVTKTTVDCSDSGWNCYKGRTIYARICTVKAIDGKLVSSPWSKTLTFKIKK